MVLFILCGGLVESNKLFYGNSNSHIYKKYFTGKLNWCLGLACRQEWMTVLVMRDFQQGQPTQITAADMIIYIKGRGNKTFERIRNHYLVQFWRMTGKINYNWIRIPICHHHKWLMFYSCFVYFMLYVHKYNDFHAYCLYF